jgi:hypothetical protein
MKAIRTSPTRWILRARAVTAVAVGAAVALVAFGSGTAFAAQITGPSSLPALSQGKQLKTTLSGATDDADPETAVLFAFVIPPGAAECPQYADDEPIEAEDLVASYGVGPGAFGVSLISHPLNTTGQWWFCAYIQDAIGNPDVPLATQFVPFTVVRRHVYFGGGERPHGIRIANGKSIHGINWSSWGKASALGRGIARFKAAGKFRSAQVKLTLSDVHQCGDKLQYLRVRVAYRKKHPFGKRGYTASYDCHGLQKVVYAP